MEIILVYILGHIYLANWQQISGQVRILQWVICCAVQCVEVRPLAIGQNHFNAEPVVSMVFFAGYHHPVNVAPSFFFVLFCFLPLGQPQQALEHLKMCFIKSIDDQALATCPDASPAFLKTGHMSTAVTL